MSNVIVLTLMATLCINGHPAPRAPDVTYGGLPIVHGMVRDHIVPLCLAGPDTAANIQYQTPSAATAKDELEWHYCELYCHGGISLDAAQQFFSTGGWSAR